MRTIKILIPVIAVAQACHAQSERTARNTYMTLDAGVLRQQDLTIKDSDGAKISYDLGFRFDYRAGTWFNDSWGAEVEVGLMHNSVKSVAGESLSTNGESLDHYQIPVMVNVLYNLPLPGRFGVHAGAGIGGVYSLFWGGNIFNSAGDLTFGFQGMLGAKYALTDHCDLGVTYKFLGTTDHDLGFGVRASGTRSHSLLMAVTFKF